MKDIGAPREVPTVHPGTEALVQLIFAFLSGAAREKDPRQFLGNFLDILFFRASNRIEKRSVMVHDPDEAAKRLSHLSKPRESISEPRRVQGLKQVLLFVWDDVILNSI